MGFTWQSAPPRAGGLDIFWARLCLGNYFVPRVKEKSRRAAIAADVSEGSLQTACAGLLRVVRRRGAGRQLHVRRTCLSWPSTTRNREDLARADRVVDCLSGSMRRTSSPCCNRRTVGYPE
jgi:hypothetical protein